MHHLLHHANCADGFAAACIARHALLSQGSTEKHLNIQPVNYGWPQQIPAAFVPGDYVTYLDYTPAQEDIDHLLFLNASLTIIDHHSTAAPRHGYLDNPDNKVFAYKATTPPFASVFSFIKSGAALTWDHFMNTQEERAPDLPRAIELIEWRDLGHAFDPAKAEDPRTADSLNLHAYLFRCLPRTFEAWTPLLLEERGADTLVRSAIQVGQRIREIDSLIIKTAADFPHWLNVHGEEIPAVNGLDAGLISDACTELLRKYPTAPFAASWFIDPKTGKATYSLRSRKDSTVNVADIAAALAPGGGGHPNAAGFSTLHPTLFV